MKTRTLHWLATAAALFFVKPDISKAQTPQILAESQGQTVGYASDVSFSVTASGAAPLGYRWFKNGQAMEDFDNVAGAHTSTLNLVGVAENDAANYVVVITNQGGSVTSSVAALSILPSVKFTEDFETGVTNWQPLFNAKPMCWNVTKNHTPGGQASLAATNGLQRMYHNLEVKYACRVVFTCWMYDDGSGLSGCAQLRGYSGPGYARYATTSSLWQELIIGKYNKTFGTNGVSGSLVGEALDTNKYQGRVLRGANQGWFNLNAPGAPNRTIGWHEFRIDRAGTGSPGGLVSFYVDGILARTITNAAGAVVNSVILGGAEDDASTNGIVCFDDLRVDAYPGLYDWSSLDSTGRNIFPDWMKLREVGTSSSVINAGATTVCAVNGASTNGGLGGWEIRGAGIRADGIRGYLDYIVNAPAADMYRIEIEGAEADHQMPIVDMPLIVSIDGETIGRCNLPYGPTSNGLTHCFTPYLQAGLHTVHVVWDNTSLYRSLYIEAIRLQSIGYGLGTGLKPWVANRLSAQCGVEYAPPSSLVSPVCVEGRGQYLSMMGMVAAAGSGTSVIQIHPGTGNRWWANVPLSTHQWTTIQTSFQNGASVVTNQIEWQPCNLLESSNLLIRQGDSLLFAAAPDDATNGQMTIAIQGAGSATSSFNQPLPYEFDQLGTFTVTGAYLPTGASGSITVTVVGASLDATIPARIFKTRYWSCTNLPAAVVLDADPRLRIAAISDTERAKITPALPQKGASEADYWIRTTTAVPVFVLARLGRQGPILAETEVQGFRWNIAPDTYLRIVDRNDDGSQIIETAFIMSPLIPSVTVQSQIIVSGVTFDDGNITKSLTANDFDETGLCRVRFIRADGVKTSTCHTTHLYDGNVLLGFQ